MMRWSKYKVSLKHGKGIIHLVIPSTSKEGAIRTALSAERAPRGAVMKVERIGKLGRNPRHSKRRCRYNRKRSTRYNAGGKPVFMGQWTLEVDDAAGMSGKKTARGYATNKYSAETFETFDGQKFSPGINSSTGHQMWPVIPKTVKKRLSQMIRSYRKTHKNPRRRYYRRSR